MSMMWQALRKLRSLATAERTHRNAGAGAPVVLRNALKAGLLSLRGMVVFIAGFQIQSGGTDVQGAGAEWAYEVGGDLHYESLRRQSTLDRKFLVASQGADWRIVIHLAHDPEAPGYEVKYHAGELRTVYQGRSSNRVDTINDGHAILELGEVPPHRLSYFVGETWLALASHQYFAARRDSQLEPLWDMPRAMRGRHHVKAEWRLLERNPGLPAEVAYFDDGNVYSDRLVGGLTTNQLPAPFQNGYLRQTYRVLETTNAGGLLLPSRFEFTTYAADFNALNTNRAIPSSKLVGQVNHIRVGNADVLGVSAMRHRIMVEDSRRRTPLSTPAVEEYLIQPGGALPDVGNSNAIIAYRSNLVQVAMSHQPRSWVPTLTLSTLLLLSVALGYLIFREKRKTNINER